MDERHPTLDEFLEGEETPLLLRRPFILSVVGVFAAVIVLYLALTQLFGLSLRVDADPLREWVEARGAFGVVVFIVLMALSVIVAPIPNVPIFIAAGLAWGPLLGTVYCMAGLSIGSACAFWIARTFGRKHLKRLIGAKTAEKLDHIADTMGGRVVLWTRLMPGLNFDWISVAAGMTSVPFRTFALYSFLGMIPLTAVTVAMGDGLDRDPRITLALGGVWVLAVVLTAGYFWLRRKRSLSRRARLLDSGVNPEVELG